MLVLGCDPGLTGAISLLRDGALLECEDLPTCSNGTVTGSMKRWIDVPRLWNLLADWSARHDFAGQSVQSVIERPIPMPTLPAQTIASQFDTFGAVRAVMAGRMREPVVCVNPNEWKRFFGLKSDKDAARATAIALYPQAAQLLKLKKSHNMAESILVAHWHLRAMS